MTTSKCHKCKDTGWNGPHVFYREVGSHCDCPVGQEKASWAALTPAQQNERAAAQAEVLRAEAAERRRVRREARA